MDFPNVKNSSPEIDAEDDSQATCLILSVLGGHFGLAQLFISKGADVNHKKQGGHSSVQYAKGYKNILELLIKNGADVNVLDDRQDSPLHRAATLGRTGVAKILIENGAKVNVQNREGNTPFHLALEDEQSEVAFLLFESGADPKILNRAKQTAIDLCKPNIKKQMRDKYPDMLSEN
ncbi:CLUMA_CG013529, isoform A [Clunio marinus]|uniref:CLUMA_CG013529, isoform A n=1 Tax=Clunio marinus TaxID=568069 RepID=A0A1J1IJ81_9DIPT|nr:CLUMA_CG013529, isoform A [Clunio marinus]